MICKQNFATGHFIQPANGIHRLTGWIQAYTDGSADGAIRNGGAGVNIRYPNGREDRTNFQQEHIPLQGRNLSH